MSLTEHEHIDISSLAGVTQDSRKVQPGYLFAAFPGERSDGRDYIDVAIKQGASVILTDPSVSAQESAQFVFADNPRQRFGGIVADFYERQPEHIVAVTGTNGKSSVVDFVTQIWSHLGYNARAMGTLTGVRTTPDPVTLHETLRDYFGDGTTHLAMEASSHGLAQYRLDGVRVSVAAFTNLSQDHLDYHADMEAYFQAKMRLFSDVLPHAGTAVLNADIPEFDALAKICESRGVRTITYGENGEDITLYSIAIEAMHQTIEISVFGARFKVCLPLIGAFQVANALCALGCVLASEEDVHKVVPVLGSMSPVRGRLQNVTDGKHHIYVDYAHTPDALEAILKTLRPFAKGRIICVFGCGGDRDASKRPLMGQIASRYADIVILTDDNPRSEEPAAIRKQVSSGISGDFKEYDDRRAAIEAGVHMMEADDVLLIAGKGHEQGQEFKENTFFFDDVEEAKKALGNLK